MSGPQIVRQVTTGMRRLLLAASILVFLAGFSQGAYIAMHVCLKRIIPARGFIAISAGLQGPPTVEGTLKERSADDLKGRTGPSLVRGTLAFPNETIRHAAR